MVSGHCGAKIGLYGTRVQEVGMWGQALRELLDEVVSTQR